MKVKTNPEHQSFEADKAIINKRTVRIGQTIGSILLIFGLILGGHALAGKNWENLQSSKEVERDYAKVMQMYEKGQLQEWKNESLILQFAPIDDNFIKSLPHDLKELNLQYESYISDLSALPEVCPNLETLVLTRCTNITNFDFVYRLGNLKSFFINREALGVTDELISYLDSKGIEHNLTHELVEVDRKVQEIAENIVNENMTDQEKVDAIVDYVIKNVKYDFRVRDDEALKVHYNKCPLSEALNGRGCCANIATLTNALCQKTGVTSYLVSNCNHGWNLVKIEGNYWYIDPTNLKSITERYLINPYQRDILLTDMGNINQIQSKAPESLLLDIDNSAEKYGTAVKIILSALAGLTIASPFMIRLKDEKNEENNIKK